MRLNAVPGARPLLRSYSLSGPPDAGSYRISVKREAHGAGSQFVYSRVRPGDLLEVAAPRGTFVLRPGDGPVLLISAGIGATPVLAMLHALAAGGSGRDVWWLHGARSRAEEPFARESRSLLAALARGHRYVCYSRPGPGDVQGRDYQAAGRLSASVLAGLGLPRDADAYICGPAAFMAEISAALADLGVEGSRVHTEVFGAAPAQTPGIAPAAPAAAPARRAARRRPGGRVRPQRRDHPLARRLRQPARAGRSLRRAGPLVMPHRRLPYLRDRPDVRNGPLRPRPGRRARRRQRPDLLLPAVAATWSWTCDLDGVAVSC